MRIQFVAIFLSFIAFNSYADVNIKDLMNDDSVGEQIDFNQISGQYTGQCQVTLRKHIFSTVQESTYEAIEALYVDKFMNAENENVNLAFSTEQAHGDITIPENLEFLLAGSKAGKSLVQKIIKEGLTGTDNNMGHLTSGGDFNFIYNSKVQNNTFDVYATKASTCSGDGRTFCNPPVLKACGYSESSNGGMEFENCIRENDITRFKKLPNKTLISHRTVDQLGQPSNNLSFVLPEISSYCVWEKR